MNIGKISVFSAFKQLIVISIMTVCMFVKEPLGGAKYITWYIPWLLCGVVFFLQLKYSIQYKDVLFYKRVFCLMTFPYACALLYTFIGSFVSENYAFTLPRAFSLVAQYVYMVVVALMLIVVFDDMGVELLSIAMIISYFLILILAIKNCGLDQVSAYLINPERNSFVKSYLERHDIGASVGLIIIYNFLLKKVNKRNIIKLSFLTFILYSCHKRIELFACIFTLVFFVLLPRKYKKITDHLLNTVLIVMFVCILIYIFIVGTDMLSIVLSSFGLKISGLNGRLRLFNSVKRFYKVSFYYTGQGFGFTEKYLSSIANTDYANLIGSRWMSQMHNDVLRIYIELGALGSTLWYMYSLFVVPHKVRAYFGFFAKYAYCVLMVFAYISYTMDNTLDYLFFQLTLLSIMFCCFKKSYEFDDKELRQSIESNNDGVKI